MAKRPSAPNGLLTNVWGASSDTYDHNDIAGWLDDIDSYLGTLFADRTPLGAIVAWSSPHLPADNTILPVPAGWAICDGRTLTSGQHDFPAPFAGQTITLPDYRGRVLIGADTAVAALTAGVAGVSNPGIRGQQGADTQIVPAHYHDHVHVHKVGGITGVETGTGGVDNAGDPYFVNTNATGSGVNLARTTHAHQLLSLYSSQGRDPANANSRVIDAPATDGSALTRNMTSLQKKTDGTNGQTGAGATGTALTTPGGGTAGDDLVVNSYPKSEGVYFIMKVKKSAGSATP